MILKKYEYQPIILGALAFFISMSSFAKQINACAEEESTADEIIEKSKPPLCECSNAPAAFKTSVLGMNDFTKKVFEKNQKYTPDHIAKIQDILLKKQESVLCMAVGKTPKVVFNDKPVVLGSVDLLKLDAEYANALGNKLVSGNKGYETMLQNFGEKQIRGRNPEKKQIFHSQVFERLLDKEYVKSVVTSGGGQNFGENKWTPDDFEKAYSALMVEVEAMKSKALAIVDSKQGGKLSNIENQLESGYVCPPVDQANVMISGDYNPNPVPSSNNSYIVKFNVNFPGDSSEIPESEIARIIEKELAGNGGMDAFKNWENIESIDIESSTNSFAPQGEDPNKQAVHAGVIPTNKELAENRAFAMKKVLFDKLLKDANVPDDKRSQLASNTSLSFDGSNKNGTTGPCFCTVKNDKVVVADWVNDESNKNLISSFRTAIVTIKFKASKNLEATKQTMKSTARLSLGTACYRYQSQCI